MSVVVGVSPTTGSPTALRWAAEEARLRNVRMHAVMAWRTPLPAAPGGRPPLGSSSVPAGGNYAAEAERILREYVDAALGPGADVDSTVVKGSAVNALLSAAEGADLLVVGEPNVGRIPAERMARLVAPQVVLKASCPVVVMPAGTEVNA
jgi:hypothetical protein